MNNTIWNGLICLALALGGCVIGGDDSGSTTITTTTPMTTGENTSDGGQTDDSTGDPPATGEGTTESVDESSSGGGVTCDPPCEPGQECIDGLCFDTGVCDPPCDPATEECVEGVCMPLPPTNSDYGPCDACAPGEMPVQVTGIDGCFCAPGCDGAGAMCPAPNDGTAQAMCALGTDPMMPTLCVLICDLAANNCPAGADCLEVQPGVGVCTHPVP